MLNAQGIKGTNHSQILGSNFNPPKKVDFIVTKIYFWVKFSIHTLFKSKYVKFMFYLHLNYFCFVRFCKIWHFFIRFSTLARPSFNIFFFIKRILKGESYFFFRSLALDVCSISIVGLWDTIAIALSSRVNDLCFRSVVYDGDLRIFLVVEPLRSVYPREGVGVVRSSTPHEDKTRRMTLL